jgi:hypothetical protein
MAQRQQILVLWLGNGDLASAVCAWAVYDGASSDQHGSGDRDQPPYPSALAALRAGWRLIQFPTLLTPPPGAEHTTGALKHQCVLERMVDTPGDVSDG